jgi:AraC-like DNA-binding protein
MVIAALNNPGLFNRLKKYKKSVLNDSIKTRYQEKLKNHMLSQKPYLNPSCSLTSLARELSISLNYLSQVINESFQQSFNDFINSYRINESKRILEEKHNPKKTILEIAYEVGFNSKSTFNKAFKKNAGCTPREFKNSLHAGKTN